MSLIADFKAWRKRRYWAARRVEFIRTQVLQDMRWLSGCDDPVAEAIMERYEAITSAHWYQRDHEPIDQFRRRIGLEAKYHAVLARGPQPCPKCDGMGGHWLGCPNAASQPPGAATPKESA